MGAFIALRCTSRAYAYEGRSRVSWLLLAAISLGTTGIWVMHFIAMLGYTIPGMTIHYNIPITIASMLIAVAVVFVGLLIVGLGQPSWRNLLIAGMITGIGVASMHYLGIAAMETHAKMSFKPTLFGLSIVIAVVAATAALWAALRLRGFWHTAGAAMIMGVAVSGMHYTGMAAMEMQRGNGAVSSAAPTAEGFLLPLIIGIGVVSLVFAGVLAFSPTNEEIREDAELMARINAATARLEGTAPAVPASPAAVTARWPGNAGRAGTPPQNPAAPPNGTPAGYPGAHPNGMPASYPGASPNGAAHPNGAHNGAHPASPAGPGHRRLPRRAAGQPPADNEPRSLGGSASPVPPATMGPCATAK